MIPAEAVEAVVNTFGRAENPRWDDPLNGYVAFSDEQKALLRDTARAALEAAAPHIAAMSFLARYAKNTELTCEQILERRIVATCECGDDTCEGFQVIPEDCLLSWRNETVLIRRPTP